MTFGFPIFLLDFLTFSTSLHRSLLNIVQKILIKIHFSGRILEPRHSYVPAYSCLSTSLPLVFWLIFPSFLVLKALKSSVKYDFFWFSPFLTTVPFASFLVDKMVPFVQQFKLFVSHFPRWKFRLSSSSGLIFFCSHVCSWHHLILIVHMFCVT